jgi:8-oxo-dGTP diphosphatase
MTDTKTTTDFTAYTADVVLLATDADGKWHLLMIERKKQPFAGQIALPGGHVEPGESPETAARRELNEEAGIAAPLQLQHIGRYDTPGRDPRGPVVSDAYLGVLDHLCRPQAGDDASDAEWMPLATILSLAGLAFDHLRIVTDACGLMTAAQPGFQTTTEH